MAEPGTEPPRLTNLLDAPRIGTHSRVVDNQYGITPEFVAQKILIDARNRPTNINIDIVCASLEFGNRVTTELFQIAKRANIEALLLHRPVQECRFEVSRKWGYRTANVTWVPPVECRQGASVYIIDLDGNKELAEFSLRMLNDSARTHVRLFVVQRIEPVEEMESNRVDP